MISINEPTAMKLYGMKLGAQVSGEILGNEFKGYLFQITGGDDKTGLPMKRSVMTDKRVKLLLKKGSTGYRCRRKGVRRRKSVRGCIISDEISVVSMVILKEGDSPIEGLTDRVVECSHLPKRATKLRRLFNIPEDTNIVEFIKEEIKKCSGSNEKIKYPRIRVTRLTTAEKIEAIKKEKEKRKLRKAKELQERAEYFQKYFPEKVANGKKV